MRDRRRADTPCGRGQQSRNLGEATRRGRGEPAAPRSPPHSVGETAGWRVNVSFACNGGAARAGSRRRRSADRRDAPMAGLRWHYNSSMDPLVLTVDMAGLPQAWVELEEAITYHAKQMVAWSLGAVVREFRGGWQRDGSRSRLSTKSILAIKGSAGRPLSHTPGLTNPMLFARDRQVCAYCGGRFLYRDLSRDHIIPASRGGRDTWMNSVTACRPCNTRKGNRAPEQANMP